MKAIVLMFDSLNRKYLSAYGNSWTHTPNFRRLAERTLAFDTSYVCSMPCMPARRDLHTGRANFLHRSWGPLEPWDDSIFPRLQNAGVYCHIATDHQHYWEEGAGGNYLSKYSSHAMFRGQEGDPHIGCKTPPPLPANAFARNAAPNNRTAVDNLNRLHICGENEMPQAKTLANGLEFIDRHADQDNWLVQIETFDPHEPFFTQPRFKEIYGDEYAKLRDRLWDWPEYAPVKEDDDAVRLMQLNYAALVSQCDESVGRVLDAMDAHNLWEDTLLIVWTDHGFLLGEHDCWAKCWMPFYEEVARTPFFVWDPRSAKAGERRASLVQPSIDIGPTLLSAFGLPPLPHATGKDLLPVIENDQPVRDTAIFGIFGAQVNLTDGEYVYMRGPVEGNQPLNEHTLMPAHMNVAFAPSELQDHELVPPFRFMQGIRPLQIPCNSKGGSWGHPDKQATLYFDLISDPLQQKPLRDIPHEDELCALLHRHLVENDAPAEQWQRLGLSPRWTQPA